jgi:hypothetical protein
MGIIKLGVSDENAPAKKHAFDAPIDNVKTGEANQQEIEVKEEAEEDKE